MPVPLTPKEQTFFASPDMFEEMLINVSGGLTLVDYCETHGLRYAIISNWINDPKGTDRLTRYGRATMARAEYFEQGIYRQLRAIMGQDIRGLLNDDGTLKDVNEWPDDIARAVAGIEIEDQYDKEGKFLGTKKKVKMNSKEKGIELMMKHRGMLTERVEHTGKLTLEQLLTESAKPTDKPAENS